MNAKEIERIAKLLSRVILDFSNVPVRCQPMCVEYELDNLRAAVAKVPGVGLAG